MKVLLYSDIHLESQTFVADPEALGAADVVVLACDIDEGTKGIRWARDAFPDHHIVYVAGNHEFYGQHWTHILNNMRESARKRDIDFLECDRAALGGVRFLGCTMWTDFSLYANGNPDKVKVAMRDAEHTMNDFSMITISRVPEFWWVNTKTLDPELVLRRHRASREWLETQLAIPFDGKTVVVTHHAPSAQSIPPQFQGNALSPAYASDLTHFGGKAAFWFHGHMHESSDYDMGGTRVICNPLGYHSWNQGFQNNNFQAGLLIEV